MPQVNSSFFTGSGIRQPVVWLGHLSVPPIVRIIGGIISLSVGGFLVLRPLSALVILIVSAAVLCGLSGLLLVLSAPRQPLRWVYALVLTVLAGAIIVFLPALARLIPLCGAVVLVANGARHAYHAMRPGLRVSGVRALAVRGFRAAYSVTSILAAWLFWMWPDAASVVVAVMFSLALMYLGIVVLVKGLKHRFPAAREGKLRQRHPRAHMIVRGVGAALMVVLVSAATFGSVRLQADNATVDDFYTWEQEIPETPGTVLRVENYEGTVPEGSLALRVLYSTTRLDDTPALASAVVAYPVDNSDDLRTVLAWQHGTTGVAQTCGPSLRPDALTELAIPGISRAIAQGWVVVATDYPGQGTPGRYPYLIGEGQGRATLDAIRAVGQIPAANASLTAWVWGHSQGGHASLWAGQIAERYAPELELLGVAALSAASDPLVLAERIAGPGTNSIIGDVAISFVLVPYADEYSDISLAATVHPAGQGLVETFASRCASDRSLLVSALSAMTLGVDTPLYRFDLNEGAVHSRLSENIAHGLVPAPLFLGQGTDDETIPITMQRNLSDQLCAIGRTVETHEYPGKTHMGVIEQGSPLIDDLYTWADAVSRKETPTNCGT